MLNRMLVLMQKAKVNLDNSWACQMREIKIQTATSSRTDYEQPADNGLLPQGQRQCCIGSRADIKGKPTGFWSFHLTP